jgi:hypothetical protein
MEFSDLSLVRICFFARLSRIHNRPRGRRPRIKAQIEPTPGHRNASPERLGCGDAY